MPNEKTGFSIHRKERKKLQLVQLASVIDKSEISDEKKSFIQHSEISFPTAVLIPEQTRIEKDFFPNKKQMITFLNKETSDNLSYKKSFWRTPKGEKINLFPDFPKEKIAEILHTNSQPISSTKFDIYLDFFKDSNIPRVSMKSSSGNSALDLLALNVLKKNVMAATVKTKLKENFLTKEKQPINLEVQWKITK
ncbi:MAG: hypothetical protein U9O87_00715 [Verrucomicrobiota bacterium]|nr:hypothetical protein [Verrucomicrobiota bacterium]